MPFTRAGLSEEGIIAEIINGADLRLFIADARKLFAVGITIHRFSHGRSTFRKFLMGAFGPIVWIVVNPRVVLAVVAVLLRINFCVCFTRFLNGRWAIDATTGSARDNARNKAGAGIIARSLEDARCLIRCVFAVSSQQFMDSETIPVFCANNWGVDRPVEVTHFDDRFFVVYGCFPNGEERRQKSFAKTRAV